MQSKNILYILACLSFSVILGAAVYEHTAVWSNAYAKMPASLTMFQGEYGLDSGIFWMTIHPVTLILFIIVLLINWSTQRKQHILYVLIIYVVVLGTTFAWFVPELLSLINSPYSNTHDEALTARGNHWETLSILRGVILFAAAIFLFMGLTKPGVKNVAA